MRYVTADRPGFSRKRSGDGFTYFAVDGKRLDDEEHLQRIRSLVLPPAWENVWICASPLGHLQAVGVDARGRKQYRYHPRYREVRNETKFKKVLDFSHALPKIRKHIHQDLGKTGLPREKVLATVVRLLETTFIRIGNVEYARENDSFGLTTLPQPACSSERQYRSGVSNSAERAARTTILSCMTAALRKHRPPMPGPARL